MRVHMPGDDVDHDAQMRDVLADARQDRDEIKRLRAIINRAGALAMQKASHELIRETLAEFDAPDKEPSE